MPDPDPDHIDHWLRLSPTLTTSGQPGEDEIAAIAALGTRQVVNLALHTHERALRDEAASVAALGMTYTHIPVAFDAPTEDDFARFCAVMASAGEVPVHVHCIVNMRVSAFVYRWRRDVLGWDEAVARREMERIWRPGGVWAAFLGDAEGAGREHRGPRR